MTKTAEAAAEVDGVQAVGAVGWLAHNRVVASEVMPGWPRFI